MIELDDAQKNRFYRRSYLAVDGLWFMKLEEKHGFEAALTTDIEVWKVMPRVQARLFRAMGGAESGMEALEDAVTAKLTLDGNVFDAYRLESGEGFEVKVSECPWHDLRAKSGRQNISGMVGDSICHTVFSVLTAQFDDTAGFEQLQKICSGADCCLFRFQR